MDRKRDNLYISRLFSISMLSVLCGVLPPPDPPPLVWAGPSDEVTGETDGGVASPQKSSELNNPPRKHKDFISFSPRSRAAPKEVLLPPSKEEEVVSQSCSGSVQIFLSSSLTRLFFILSPPSLSTSFLLSFGLCKHLHVLLYCSSISSNSAILFSSFCLFMSLFSFIVTVQPSASGSCNAHLLSGESRLLLRFTLLLNKQA